MRSDLAVLALSLLAAPSRPSLPQEERRSALGGFVRQHCADCHGADAPKAGLRLDEFRAAFDDEAGLAAGVKIFDRVRTGEMPPRKNSAPPEAERRIFVEALGRELEAADRKLARARIRRLSRVELEHTLRDLLALPSLRVKEELPEDVRQDGFDKVAGARDVSAVHISKVLAIADRALRQAVARDGEAPKRAVWREPALRQDSAHLAIRTMDGVPLQGRELASGYGVKLEGDPVKDPANTYKVGTFSGKGDSFLLFTGPRSPRQATGLQPDRFRAPVAGWYRVRFSVWGLSWKKTRAEAGALQVVRVSLGGRPLKYFDAPSLRPTIHELDVWLEPGRHVSFHGMTLPAHGPDNWGSKDGPRSYEGPGVAFDDFEIEGPLEESHRRVFGAAGLEDRERLRAFAERAFRRPVEAAEVDRVARLVDDLKGRGRSPREALLSGYRAILCDPAFHYLGLEGTPGFALASRLSYFLWDSGPDDVLLDAARRGELATSDGLRAQVRRLLADAKSDRFVEHFLDEWLELRNIDFTTPDPQLYPDFDPWLRDAMLEETRATFRRMLDEDRGVAELVRSDTVLVNQRLARLYELPGVEGAALRGVAVPKGLPRGGFLTQAAILKVTANGTSTSPILRGAWISERLLGLERRPPPAEVPAIDPDARGATSIREIVEKHRADPSCAGCHARFDPPGLALESFDAIGRRRDHYRGSDARGKRQTGPKVDPSGKLPDGRTFEDVDGLARLLSSDPEALARNVVLRLLTYAAGRRPGFADRADVEAVLEKAKHRGFGLRSLLEEAVVSPVFRGEAR